MTKIKMALQLETPTPQNHEIPQILRHPPHPVRHPLHPLHPLRQLSPLLFDHPVKQHRKSNVAPANNATDRVVGKDISESLWIA